MKDCFTFSAHRVSLEADGALLLTNRISGATLQLPASTLAQWQKPSPAQRRQTTLYAPALSFTAPEGTSRYGVLHFRAKQYVIPHRFFTLLSNAILVRQVYAGRSDTPTLCKLISSLVAGCSIESLYPPRATVLSLAG